MQLPLFLNILNCLLFSLYKGSGLRPRGGKLQDSAQATPAGRIIIRQFNEVHGDVPVGGGQRVQRLKSRAGLAERVRQDEPFHPGGLGHHL